MPQIAQQDYIYIDVPALDDTTLDLLTNDQIRQLYRAARNGTINDVIFRQKTSTQCNYSRIISSGLSIDSNLIIVYYALDIEEIYVGSIVHEPDPEPTEE